MKPVLRSANAARPDRSLAEWGVLNAMLALSYVCLALLSQKIATAHLTASPAWPGAGVGVAVAILGGWRLLPGIFLGAFSYELFVGYSAMAAGLAAFMNVVEAAFGGWLYGRVVARGWGSARVREVIGLTLAALVGPIPAALLGPLALAAGDMGFNTLYVSATWWVGDFLGIFLLTPWLLSLAHLESRRWREWGKYLGVGGGIALATFGLWRVMSGSGQADGLIFAVFPFLLLVYSLAGPTALRFAAVTVGATGVAETYFGRGLFAPLAIPINEGILRVQLFLVIVGLVGLVLPLLRQPGRFRVVATVLLVGWSVSGWWYLRLSGIQDDKQRATFASVVGKASDVLHDRFMIYGDVLRSGSALFAVQTRVSRQEWRRFAETINLTQRYPGINGIGVIYPVAESNEADFVARERFNGAPDFSIVDVPGPPSPVPSGAERYVITYIEPLASNRPALGLDIGSEINRRAAAELARDTGEPAVTQRITLVQDGKRGPGFLYLVPIYNHALPLDTVEERRAALIGWTYAPFITERFIRGALGRRLDEMVLRVYEGEAASREGLVFDSDPHGVAGWGETLTQTLRLGGLPFTFAWQMGPAYPVASRQSDVLGVGVLALLTLLLAALIMSLQTSRERANAIVAEQTEAIQSHQRALAASEERLRLAAEGASVGVWELDLQTRVAVWDETTFRIFGLEPTPDGVTSADTWLQAMHPDDLVEQEALVRQLEAEGGRQERVFRIHRPNGEVRHVRSLERWIGEVGSARIIGVNLDITDQVLAEASLRQSEEQFRQAFTAAGIGMAIIGLDGRWLEVNESLCQIVGYTREELAGMTFGDVTHGEDLDEDLQNVAKLFSGELPFYKMEKRYVRKGGALVWVRLTASLVRDAGGEPVHFVSQIEDIDTNKMLSLALRESEMRTRLFAEHAPASVAMFDCDMRYLVVSKHWLEDYGLTEKDVMGRSHYELFPSTTAARRELYRRCLAGEIASSEGERLPWPDGTMRWVQWQVRPWRNADGAIGGIVMFTQDITARIELEENLAVARDQALEASRLKSAFLANMSHEIRTPMNGVIGMAELMAETSLDQEQRSMNETIIRSADALLVVINDILDFSKIEANRMELGEAPFDLRRALEDVCELLRPRAEQKGLTVELEVDQSLAKTCLGDEVRLKQVVTNLLGNAIKFTEAGGATVRLKVLSSQGKRQNLRMEVVDTGMGIPVAAQDKLFVPFSQIDGSSSRQFGGTGLGLAISRQLVELMGGRVGLESEEGKGSTFYFDWAVNVVSEAVAPSIPAGELASLPPSGRRVLVAEDNPANQVVTRINLERLGYVVDVAENGEEALALAANNDYAFVLMDCQMPGVDGYEATRRIRAGEVPRMRRDIPIIALTAYAMSGDRAKCLESGMTEFVTKPMRVPDLKAALQKCETLLAETDSGPGVAPEPPPADLPLSPEEITSAESSFEEDLIDSQHLAEMAEIPGRDHQTLAGDLVQIFLGELENTLPVLSAQIEAEQSLALGISAHRFAGSCASVGASGLREQAIALEESAKANDWSAARAAWDRLLARRVQTQDRLKTYQI